MRRRAFICGCPAPANALAVQENETCRGQERKDAGDLLTERPGIGNTDSARRTRRFDPGEPVIRYGDRQFFAGGIKDCAVALVIDLRHDNGGDAVRRRLFEYTARSGRIPLLGHDRLRRFFQIGERRQFRQRLAQLRIIPGGQPFAAAGHVGILADRLPVNDPEFVL